MVIVLVQPYKKDLSNKVDVLILLNLLVGIGYALFYSSTDSVFHDSYLVKAFFTFLLALPVVSMMCYISFMILKQIWGKWNSHKKTPAAEAQERKPLLEEFPDRLEHPDDYNLIASL